MEELNLNYELSNEIEKEEYDFSSVVEMGKKNIVIFTTFLILSR